MKNVNIYLAGAIRDTHPEDILWRERFIQLVRKDPSLKHSITLLNPLAGKKRNATGVWEMSGREAKASCIVPQDFWCIRRADIIIANFSSFIDGYPSIGTVMETGAAGILNKLIYAIVDPTSEGFGVENKKNFTLHPFIQELCADVFESEEAAFTFLRQHLLVLTGQAPECLEPTT